MRTHNVAVIPGDGIGTEVIGAGKKVLEALAKKNGDFTFNQLVGVSDGIH